MGVAAGRRGSRCPPAFCAANTTDPWRDGRNERRCRGHRPHQPGPHGEADDESFTTLAIPAEAERFDEINVGDAIRVRYYDVVSVRVKPADEPDVDSASASVIPTPGPNPGGTAATQRTITATIAEINRDTRAVTYTGPAGFRYTRRAGDDINLDEFEVGDRIDVTWTEAVQIAINP